MCSRYSSWGPWSVCMQRYMRRWNKNKDLVYAKEQELALEMLPNLSLVVLANVQHTITVHEVRVVLHVIEAYVHVNEDVRALVLIDVDV